MKITRRRFYDHLLRAPPVRHELTYHTCWYPNLRKNKCHKLDHDLVIPQRLAMLLDRPPALLETQLKYSWNPDDRSPYIFIEEDQLTIHRYPVLLSTDCIRGKTGFTKGLHVWEICWPIEQRGTNATVGVATADAPLHALGYQCLVGRTDASWGWDIGRNKLHHRAGNTPDKMYPVLQNPEDFFVVPDKFLVVLNMDNGTLSFVANGLYLGIAFTGLKGKRLYPIINVVWGRCEVSMKYIGGLDPKPLPLKDLCRQVVRRRLGRENITEKVTSLILPQTVQHYLLYRDWR